MSVSDAVRKFATGFVRQSDDEVRKSVQATLELIDPTGRIVARPGNWAVNMEQRILYYNRSFAGRPLTDVEYTYLTFHEGGHLLFTQKLTIPPKAKANADKYAETWNACEDMRMERHVAKRFPGFARIRNNVAGRLLQESNSKQMMGLLQAGKHKDPAAMLRMAWLEAMAMEYGDLWYNQRSWDMLHNRGYSEHNYAYHVPAMKQALIDTLPLFRSAAEADTMTAMMPFVDAIYDYFFPPQSTPPEPPAGEQGDDEGEPDEGEQPESTEGGGESESDDTEGDEEESQGGGQDESEGDEESQGDDGSHSSKDEGEEELQDDEDTEGEGGSESSDDDAADGDESEGEGGEDDGDEADDATEGEPGEGGSQDGESTEGDSDEGESDESDEDGGNSAGNEGATEGGDDDLGDEDADDADEGEGEQVDPTPIYDDTPNDAEFAEYDESWEQARGGWKRSFDTGSAAGFATTMRSMLRRSDTRGKRRGQLHGDFDAKRWVRQTPFDYRWFNRRLDPTKPQYALIISIDTSGSMGAGLSGRTIAGQQSKADLALRAAATMAESWRRLNLPFTIFGWGTQVTYVVDDGTRPDDLDYTYWKRSSGGGTNEHVVVDPALHLAMRYASMGFQPIWFHFADGDSQTHNQEGIDLYTKTFGLLYYIGIGRQGSPRVTKWPNVTIIERPGDLLDYMRDTVRSQVYRRSIRL